eukprot:350372-Chlamydomonas_euryale.AAC.4
MKAMVSMAHLAPEFGRVGACAASCAASCLAASVAGVANFNHMPGARVPLQARMQELPHSTLTGRSSRPREVSRAVPTERFLKLHLPFSTY